MYSQLLQTVHRPLSKATFSLKNLPSGTCHTLRLSVYIDLSQDAFHHYHCYLRRFRLAERVRVIYHIYELQGVEQLQKSQRCFV